MNERQYLEAQHSLFESLAFDSVKAAVVPLRKEYVNAATCLTVVHLLREQLALFKREQSTTKHREVGVHLRAEQFDHFRIDASDAVMLPRQVQDVVLAAEPAVLAAAAGLTTWYQPEWSFTE